MMSCDFFLFGAGVWRMGILDTAASPKAGHLAQLQQTAFFHTGLDGDAIVAGAALPLTSPYLSPLLA